MQQFFVRSKHIQKQFNTIQGFCRVIRYTKKTKIMNEVLVQTFRKIVPVLSPDTHKGSCGRIGVFGGSTEFTGAPYFASMSALRTGSDLVYVFCSKMAAPVIKSYSPELMVLPYLDCHDPIGQIIPWLEKLHVILIGPGLGRSAETFKVVNGVISLLKQGQLAAKRLPLVVDADGLWFLVQNPTILDDYPGDVYLTPNVNEFYKLVGAMLNADDTQSLHVPTHDVGHVLLNLALKLGGKYTIVLKGQTDLIASRNLMVECMTEGSLRRCGGQGDLLSGMVSTFAFWATEWKPLNCEKPDLCDHFTPGMVAAYGACFVTRLSNRTCFQEKGRGMLASDMIQQIPKAFKVLCGE